MCSGRLMLSSGGKAASQSPTRVPSERRVAGSGVGGGIFFSLTRRERVWLARSTPHARGHVACGCAR